MLRKFMYKHGITIEDIEGEEMAYYDFKFKSKLEENLIYQISTTVIGSGAQRYHRRGVKNVTAYRLTKAQYVEFEMKYSIWRKLLDEEMELFYEALVQRNDIYPKDKAPREISTLSKDQQQRARRVMEMSESIKKANILKQLQAH